MKTIITIGRQFGSGGAEIGKKLAEYFGIPYYDDELLNRASKDSGICQEVFANQDEKPSSSFLYSLVMDTYSMNYPTGLVADMPLNQKVFLAQHETIQNLAKEGPCVIIGRCGDYALENFKNVLNVFIYADMDSRIDRIAMKQNCSQSKAKDRINKMDKQRSSYYNYYTDKKWGDPQSYDLCINSSKVGVEGCVEIIKNIVLALEK